jgi:hypothetical protein
LRIVPLALLFVQGQGKMWGYLYIKMMGIAIEHSLMPCTNDLNALLYSSIFL